MTLRPVRLWPDPVLCQVCPPVAAVDAEVRALAADMLETMYAAPGRGLAAPQVGVLSRLFVMDITWKEAEPDPMVFINPEILAASEEQATFEEGCLSIPDVLTPVTRPAQVRMAWTDLDGHRQERAFEGVAAVCVQHELDHLNGIVTFDRLAPDARAAAEEAYAR
ncbi:peptide deformylase [Flavimaricola marinus]|uniref:Peptide deformylase n=1 Tax=Flavimaricola marinus TaxID=1819565 RepID=A0A238LA58_9RHOB|nr:peptide deformylase [Flavimaricola marinus]SMY06491.1 Peptide deformylase [Flavimaricola marinus]